MCINDYIVSMDEDEWELKIKVTALGVCVRGSMQAKPCLSRSDCYCRDIWLWREWTRIEWWVDECGERQKREVRNLSSCEYIV